MNNQEKYNTALEIEAKNLGITESRYGTYSKSIGAANNRLQASWESLWQATINDQTVIDIVNASAKALELTKNLGGIVPVLGSILVGILAIKRAAIIASLVQIKNELFGIGAVLKVVFTSVSTVNIYTAAIVALAGAIALLSINADMAKNSINVMYDNFEKSLNIVKDNQTELQSLVDEYKFISGIESLSADDKTRLLDIQSILNAKYRDSITPMNLYTDAVDKNSEAVA